MIKICDRDESGLPRFEAEDGMLQSLCPVDAALQIAAAARSQSCGRGTMCRDGINQLYHIISDIIAGKGKAEDPELLREICGIIAVAADCRLAEQTALRIKLLLETYAEEWNAHIIRRKCTALVCREFYTLHILPGKCSGCRECLDVCPENCIAGGEGLIHVIDNDRCTRCGLCIKACKADAVVKAGGIKPKCPLQPVKAGSFESEAGLRRRRRERGESNQE
jgi:NAD-dependent dihydropyrimidine dehydrogenase PreA subunit